MLKNPKEQLVKLKKMRCEKMIYSNSFLPEPWKLIVHSLKDRPKSFEDLLKLGIDRHKMKEILDAMIKLNMIQETAGCKYSLKSKEVRLK